MTFSLVSHVKNRYVCTKKTVHLNLVFTVFRQFLFLHSLNISESQISHSRHLMMSDRTQLGPEKWVNDELRSTMARKLEEAIRVTGIHTEQNAMDVERGLFDKAKS